jgi:DNA-binding beta-propeller fold protein YncE
MAGALLFGAIAVASPDGQSAQSAQQTAPAVPVLPYKQVEWPIQATSAAGVPLPWNFIQVSSVAILPRGTVLVLHRGAHPLLEFDRDGKLIKSWNIPPISEGKVAGIAKNLWAPDKSRYSAVYGPAGCDSCGAHSVRLDPQGNIWVIDATGYIIYKLNQDGKELMHLGTKGTAGAGQTTFNLPTDIAFAPNGDLYVTDGYGGARVVKFSHDGKYLLEFGKRGDGPGEFRLPHNLVIDPQGRVYVTDRDNQRVEVFDAMGKFITEWKGTGGVSGMALTKDGRIWTGAVLRDLNGKPIGRLADAPAPHGVAMAADSGDVYLAQLSGVVQKFVRQ